MSSPDFDSSKRAFITGAVHRAKTIFQEDGDQKVFSELDVVDHLLKKGTDLLVGHKVGRRPLLQAVGAAVVSLMLASSAPSFISPSRARAEEEWIVVGPDPEELNQRHWFPYDAALARDRNLMRMHALGGPLDIHDQITGRHAREWEEDTAHSALRRQPLQRSWLGHCDDVANVMAFHLPLPREVRSGRSFWFEGLEINKTTLMGLYAEEHAPDMKITYRKDSAGIEAVLLAATKKGWASVVNIPGADQQGQVWSYIVTKIRADLGAVEAHNFERTITASTSEIRGIYFPYHYNPNDLELVAEIDKEVRAVRAKTAHFFNPELDYEFIEAIRQF